MACTGCEKRRQQMRQSREAAEQASRVVRQTQRVTQIETVPGGMKSIKPTGQPRRRT